MYNECNVVRMVRVVVMSGRLVSKINRYRDGHSETLQDFFFTDRCWHRTWWCRPQDLGTTQAESFTIRFD